MSTKIITIANHKGGVGKTTSTASIGSALAIRGKKVLLRTAESVLYPLSLLIMSWATSLAQSYSDTMRIEAIRFIDNMPVDLQDKQNDAIKAAISGDLTALENVRNSRNRKPDIPSGVNVIDISKNYRLFTSNDPGESSRRLLIYLHGGGWCFGSINSCTAFCTELVKTSGISVLAVDYPLSPEHPYPAALNACVEALSYAHSHAEEIGINPAYISIGGDSAGGNLALATAIYMIYTQEQIERMGLTVDLPKIHSLVLFYPVVKVWNDNSESWKTFSKGYGLDGEIMETFNKAYVGEADSQLPLISPFNTAYSHLAQLPPILLINADRDILRDQGKEMFDKIIEAGVKVQREVLPGTTHLFITVPGQPTAFTQSVRLATDFILERMP